MMAEDAEQIIRDLEERLRKATLENDVAETDIVLDDGWVNINANGTVTSKAQTLAAMPKFRFLAIENEGVQIRMYPGVAVVTGQSTRRLEIQPDRVSTSRVWFTRVYAQPGGQWKLVSSQATPLTASEPARA